MQIKAIHNFVHAPSRRSFQIGQTYDVTDKSADEFIKGALAVAVPVEEPKAEEPKAEETKAKKIKGE